MLSDSYTGWTSVTQGYRNPRARLASLSESGWQHGLPEFRIKSITKLSNPESLIAL